MDLLRKRGASLPDMTVEERDIETEMAWLGEGYGHPTPEGERTRAGAAAQEGLALDPVYTAKAMAGLLALRERGRFGDGPVLFWQTHDTTPAGAPA